MPNRARHWRFQCGFFSRIFIGLLWVLAGCTPAPLSSPTALPPPRHTPRPYPTLPPTWTPTATWTPLPPTATWTATPTLTLSPTLALRALCERFSVQTNLTANGTITADGQITLVVQPLGVAAQVLFRATSEQTGQQVGGEMPALEMAILQISVAQLPTRGRYAWELAVVSAEYGTQCQRQGFFTVLDPEAPAESTAAPPAELTAEATPAVSPTSPAAITPEVPAATTPATS